MKKLLVDDTMLREAIEYVNSIIEALDVDDPTEFEEGYEHFITPLEKIAFEDEGIDKFAIAKEINVDAFKESLENIYDVDTSGLSFEEIEEIFDEVEELLAGSDEYSEIYNDSVWQILKNHNLG